MFPYPSSNGLHIGHYYNYAVIDSYCRYLRYIGEEVFQPFGYDAFGLPAENYARSIGGDPKVVTYDNIDSFRNQLARMNTQYKELLITSDESYQKWTKWLFTQLHNKGLAYKKLWPVNYCNKCETVLANEQAKDFVCDRCGSHVEIKELNQWFFKITDYKDRLIKNLETLDYPEKTKKQQLHWLNKLQDWCVSRQRKWGCPIPIEGETDTLDTFVDSSFYFIRYCDSENPNELAEKSKIKQVDLYVGGNEHACMHLIYARFINMFLYDMGITPFEEPFKRLIHQGMINFNGKKMSKSLGNTISPDNYDPDVLRLYLMFIGPYLEGGEWSDQNIKGVERFLKKFQRWLIDTGNDEIDVSKLKASIFNFTKSFKFNRVVSELMIFYNTNKHLKPTINSRDELLNIIRIYTPGFTL